MVEIYIASKKIFIEKIFLNLVIFSGFLFANTIKINNISARAQENIGTPKVISPRSFSSDCCKKSKNYLQDNRLKVFDNIVEDVLAKKNQYQIPNNLRACHSAQISNYTILEHISIESINKLFREKPIINSLAFLGLPLGSTGMEIHNHDSHFHEYKNYKILSFSKIGKTKIFDKILT